MIVLRRYGINPPIGTPEPEWKYLSGFAVKKGHPAPEGEGLTSRSLTPRRGPVTTMTNPSSQDTLAPPADAQQEQLLADINEDTANITEDPSPVHH